MTESSERLARDLAILTTMAEGMDGYLRSEALFGPMPQTDMPRLTIGGYLMRQHRLLALRHLLTAEQQQQLDDTIAQFNQALVERIVRFEEKAHTELEARLRQWQEQINDLRRERERAADYYPATVETRAMMAALLDRLRLPPYQLDEQLARRVAQLDGVLRNRWQKGPFVWPEEWQPAYPADRYWWLYGQPV